MFDSLRQILAKFVGPSRGTEYLSEQSRLQGSSDWLNECHVRIGPGGRRVAVSYGSAVAFAELADVPLSPQTATSSIRPFPGFGPTYQPSSRPFTQMYARMSLYLSISRSVHPSPPVAHV